MIPKRTSRMRTRKTRSRCSVSFARPTRTLPTWISSWDAPALSSGSLRAARAGIGADLTPPERRAPAPGAAPAQSVLGPAFNVRGLPMLKPPYGHISAINMDKGEIVWQVPNGETPDFIRNNAALKGLDIPNTGQPGYDTGTLVTKTLVIQGDTQVTSITHPRGAMLRAYDKATGKELGAILMPAPQTGSPMTYSLNGKQYIVVAISGGSYSGEYVAFSVA